MERSGTALEIEVKVPASSVEEARGRLAKLPARPEATLLFEDNDIYDTPQGALAAAGSMLRLRVAGGETLITFKERVETNLNAKVRREVQATVGSASAMREIISKLGLVRVYRYQKYRAYFGWNDPVTGERLAICLDDTPIGVFIELEGPKESIDRAAIRMGYVEGEYILEDYRALHQAYLRRRGLPPGDLLFPDSAAGSPPDASER